jgi:excisionase family DNA binding protein
MTDNVRRATFGLEKLAYSVEEAALLLGVSPNHLRNERTRGKLRFSKLGRRAVILATELRRYLEESSDQKVV